MPLAVTMVIVLFLVGMGLLQVGFHARLQAILSSFQISARAAADAGIAHALYEMNNKFDPNQPWDNTWLPPELTGTFPSSYGSATYTCNVTGVLGTHQAVSVGTAGRGIKTVFGTFRLISRYDYALIVEEGITLKAGTLIDGYNSNNPSDTDVFVKIGTISTEPGAIWLNNGVVVDGDVLVGFGGEPATVIKDLGATTGPRYPLPQDIELDMKTPPVGLPPGQPIVFDSNGVATITESGVYGSIELPEGHVLRVGDGLNNVVDAVIYITGDLWLKHAAELRVTGDPALPSTWSSLTIYLDGMLTAGNSNGINNETEKPGRFKLIGTGPEGLVWEIKNAGDFFGVFDAPNAHLIIKQSADIYGAVIGKSFDLRESGNLYYDKDLTDPTLYGSMGFGLDRWWEQ